MFNVDKPFLGAPMAMEPPISLLKDVVFHSAIIIGLAAVMDSGLLPGNPSPLLSHV